MTQKCFGSLFVFLIVAGCGDDNQKPSSPGAGQLVQDIRQTDYALKNASWRVILTYDGASEDLSKKTSYQGGQSKDHIQRILDNGQFFIFTNEVKADRIAISPDGALKDDQSIVQRLPGCSLSGRSQMSGKATHAQLQLVWKLHAQLDGGAGCDTVTSLKEQFKEFVENEVSRLNLRSGQDLLKATEQSLQSARRIQLELVINGDMKISEENKPE